MATPLYHGACEKPLPIDQANIVDECYKKDGSVSTALPIEESGDCESGTILQTRPSGDEENQFECQISQEKFVSQDSISENVCPQSSDKQIKCSICSEEFADDINLEQHVKSHTNERVYVCSICNTVYKHSCSLRRHMKTHTGLSQLQCSYCDKIFHRPEHLKIHERSHTGVKPYECELCDRAFTQISTLISHRRVHTGERPYACTYCPGAFKDRPTLLSHERLHTGERPYKCEFCGKAFISCSKLSEHKKRHIRPFQCGWCEKSYGCKRYLKTHEMTHTGEKPFPCTRCEQAFVSVSLRTRHEKGHDNAKGVGRVVIDPEGLPEKCNRAKSKLNINIVQLCRKENEGLKKIVCDEEDVEYCESREDLRSNIIHRSLKIKQEGLDEDEITEAPLDSIVIEGRSDSVASTNQRDSTVANEQYLCNICGVVFSSTSSLSLHKEEHNENRSFLCAECARSFKTNSQLKNHKLVHLPEKPFECPLCPKRFCSMGKRRCHLNVHERKFVCETCEKACPTAGELKLHETTHLNLRPLVCELCSKNFSNKKTLKEHIVKIHHRDGNSREVQSKILSRKDEMKNGIAGEKDKLKNEPRRRTIGDKLTNSISEAADNIKQNRSRSENEKSTKMKNNFDPRWIRQSAEKTRRELAIEPFTPDVDLLTASDADEMETDVNAPLMLDTEAC